MRWLLALSLVLLYGCPAPQPAPKDIDGLAKFFFNRFDPLDDSGAEQDPALSDAELQDGLLSLMKSLDGDNFTEPQKGTLTILTADELHSVAMDDVDPTMPQGLYTATIVHCTLAQIDAIQMDPDQKSIYPDQYETYERTFDADRPDNLPTWSNTFKLAEQPLLSNQFTATVQNGLRRIPASEEKAIDSGLARRAFMPSPATFESEGSEYPYDFEIEAWLERAAGEVVHFNASWRYMKIGALGDSTSSLFFDRTVQNNIDWDKETETNCATR